MVWESIQGYFLKYPISIRQVPKGHLASTLGYFSLPLFLHTPYIIIRMRERALRVSNTRITY